jgi:hypothetical protein
MFPELYGPLGHPSLFELNGKLAHNVKHPAQVLLIKRWCVLVFNTLTPYFSRSKRHGNSKGAIGRVAAAGRAVDVAE